MSIERTFYCNGPECERHVTTAMSRPSACFIFVTDGHLATLHFCGWDCVLKYAATIEPEEVIPA